MTDTIKKQNNATLSNNMWRACDILRRDNNVGGVMQYTEHLAWLLFLKFLDEEEKRRADEAAIEGSNYAPILQGDLAWDAWASPEKIEQWKADELIQFVRGRLLPGLASLTGSPLARTIARIFSDEATGDQNIVRNVPVCASGYNLKDVLSVVNTINFASEDDVYTISKFYEDLLNRMSSENRTAGEFYTPRPIIRLMVEIIAPCIGETVYDPACGSAGFLAQAYEYMSQQVRTVEEHEKLQHETFYGQEKKAISALLGTMNMVLHGVATPNIIRINTLEENTKGSVNNRYDVILTNPPFGGTEGRHIQENFAIQSNATELLFLQHIIKKLKRTPNARTALVVPEGTLFRSSAFASVKADLMEQFHLFAVISLPPGTFAPYSDVKTALLFFQRPDKVLATNPAARRETWYYEVQLPAALKKFSKGSSIQIEHLTEAMDFCQRWQAYLKNEAARPFEYAADLRDRWRVHYAWEAYRNDSTGKVARPEIAADDSPAAITAHRQEGPRPPAPYHSWIETLDDLKARQYDLSARNPNQNTRVELASPAELLARLHENTRILQTSIESLQAKIAKRETQE